MEQGFDMHLGKILLSGYLVLQAVLASAQSSLPDAPAARPMVYQMSSGVTLPKVVYAVDPEFTEEARKHHLRGITTISLVVDAHGRPQEVKVFRSLAETVDPKYRVAAKGLDDKAVEAASQYRFQPGTLKGKPVAVAIHLEVNFQLF